MHSINGLDSASVTTFPADVETLIVVGAAGFAAQERIMETEGRYVPTKLKEWADSRLRQFEIGLDRIARREGVKYSGIASMPSLDRWDTEGGW